MGRIVGQNETRAQPSTHPPASRDSAARPDIEELRRLVEVHGVRQKPWELYEGRDLTYSIFGRHPDEEYDDEENLPCRITTGGDFDDLESARLAVLAVNALPYLLAALSGPADPTEDTDGE